MYETISESRDASDLPVNRGEWASREFGALCVLRRRQSTKDGRL